MASRRKNNSEDLAKLQQLFEDDFGKPQGTDLKKKDIFRLSELLYRIAARGYFFI